MPKAKIHDVRRIINQVQLETDACLLAEHQSDMSILDLEEVIHKALSGFNAVNWLWNRSRITDAQLVALAKRPREFGSKILQLIEVAQLKEKKVAGAQEFQRAFDAFETRVSSIERRTKEPYLNTDEAFGPIGRNDPYYRVFQCDAAIDFSLLGSILAGLAVAGYTTFSPWAGFLVGAIFMSLVCATVCAIGWCGSIMRVKRNVRQRSSSPFGLRVSHA
jgi:hypothetical protein